MTDGTEWLIALEDVHKAFGPLHVLRGVSFGVRRGETLVVIGQSGTGKSVTLRLVIGLLAPDAGRVLFEGADLTEFDDERLLAMRQRMAMLFQGGALFDSMTVGENVAFGRRSLGERDEARLSDIVEEKLRQVGLQGTAGKMPSELSGGMRKRAALARSLAMNPDIILYDEPTTGLDPIMSDAIADLILETRNQVKSAEGKDVTSLVVTHDMHVAAKVADRIVMLHGGRVVGVGAPDYFEALRRREEPAGLSEAEAMIRQFVRGEAAGPIQAVR